MDQARAEMASIGAQLESQYPDIDKGYRIWVVPLLDQVVRRCASIVRAAGRRGFRALIACVNGESSPRPQCCAQP